MNKFIKNSFLYTITNLIINAASFLLLPLYTRLLTPEEYGNIYIMQTIASIIAIITSVQLVSSISRYYYEYKDDNLKVMKMYSSIVTFIFYCSSTIYLILIIFNDKLFRFLDVPFFPYMFIVLISSYLNIYYGLITSLLYAKEEGEIISKISIMVGIGGILVTILLVTTMSDKLLAYLLGQLLQTIIQFFIFVYFSKPYYKFKFKLFNIKELFLYSFERLPIGLSSYIVTFSDRFMVYGVLGSYENGLYSIGYKLGQASEMLVNSVNKAYVPYVFSKYKNNTKDNRIKVINIAQYVFTLFICMTFGIAVFSKEIIFLLDNRYNDALKVMIIIIFSYLLNAIKLVFHCPMDYVREYGRIKSFIWTLSAIINVILNVILIPIYGMYGAAYATFISYLVTLIPILYYSNKAMNIKYNYRIMSKIVLVSFIYLFLILLNVSLISFLFKLVISIIYIMLLMKINELYVLNIIKSLLKRKGKNG